MLKEQDQLSMFQLDQVYLEESLILLVMQLMVLVPLNLTKDKELNLKPQVSFQENQCTNLCKLDLSVLTPLCQLEEDKESSLSEIDKLERPLLQLILLSIKRNILTMMIKQKNYIVFTLLLDKRDLL